MRVEQCQRWNRGRASYRPAREVIDTTEFDVCPIQDDVTAKRFVVQHHYSHSYPAARFRYGLYRFAELVGVAVFSVPAQPRALDVLPGRREESVELGRFVLVDEVLANGESWFIARCFELLKQEGVVGVISFSDPAPRFDSAGAVIHPGHVGTIYQATNGVYLGRSKPDTQLLLPDGTCLHRRAVSKVRHMERGWRYVVAKLEQAGAPPLRRARPSDWIDTAIAAVTRRRRHPGNHKYAWTMQRRDRKCLPSSLRYPKLEQFEQLSLL